MSGREWARAASEWPRAAAAAAYHVVRRNRVTGPLLLRAIEAKIGRAPTAAVLVRRGALRGMTLEIDPRVQADVILGIYERRLSRHVLDTLRAGDLAFDVGSHTGYFALLMATAVGAGGGVVCFEPNESLHGLLEGNVLRNSQLVGATVSVAGVAVGATTGSTTFFRDTHSTRGRLDVGGDSTVEVVTLDEAVRRFGPPRFVKVDVEGGEADVLAGGRELLESGSCGFGIEVHSRGLGARCSELLRDHGYDCRFVRDAGRPETYLLAVPPRA